MDENIKAAIEEAKTGLNESGIPIGSVLVYNGKIIGRGHNRRVQKNSVILHAEMDALENAGRQRQMYIRNVSYIRLFHLARCAAEQYCFMASTMLLSEKTKLSSVEKTFFVHRG